MLATDLEPILLPLHAMVFFFGCVVGSFLNVVVWRVPRGESLLHPPSHCPLCGHGIRAWENIPIVSWLCLGGRCSACKARISIRYPLGEAATGLLFWLIWISALMRHLPLAVLPGYFYLTGSLLAAALIDRGHRIIPDAITLPGLLLAFCWSLALPASRLALVAPDDPHSGAMLYSGLLDVMGEAGAALGRVPIAAAAVDCLLGAAVGFTLLAALSYAGRRLLPGRMGRDVMGFGDVKLLALIGAFLGADACIYVLLAAAFAGFLCGACRRLLGHGGLMSAWPFGPYLAVAAYAWMAAGNYFFILMRGLH
ncbi:prepilin peptidase [Oligosphaera ethanolica]|uniref:Leader peptidase (Prepilin peptidase)/N-methyltransferase n=1 Tax=Oligosphaera ethanolica TaxID=760260 RepID=A0AAE3VCZ7_9BACT|nr:A24 family peptidase [Oligosphaera ethanolica]MDQ0287944.1 leader peptidase (prepilin peptidase)/N-methyltransferase [Oligosphaera ethanolica]